MKKILILSFLSIAGFLTTVVAQTFQATIKQGSAVNSVYVVVKPSGNVTGQISSMQFALAIPKTVSPSEMPAYSVTSFIPGLTYVGGIQTSEETADGVLSYVYTFSGVGDATVANTAYVGGTEYNIAEVFLYGAPAATNVKLIQLPDGGTTFNSNFYMALGGVEVENSSNQFYGTGSVNDGNSFSGTSFAVISNISLPVNILSFYALKNGEAAKLTWNVANDETNKYFDIERSIDGRTYTAFGRVNALDNGKSTNTYEFADPSLANLGSNSIFYRIKQVDRDGSVTYSQIRNLILTRNLSLSLYPNPARTTTKLVIDVPVEGKAVIVIRDITGKQVQAINTLFVKGINQKQINVSSLPKGDYNLSIIGEQINQTIKLAKQ